MSLSSIRRHAKEDITGRWTRLSRPILWIQQPGLQIADTAENHSGDAFFGCDNALESVLFSVLLELRTLQDAEVHGVDP
jgi:hypothetical protein